MDNTTKGVTVVDVTVGDRIRGLRLSLGMSQGSLAQALGVTFQQVQKYENGRNRLSVSRLVATAAALGVSVRDLLPDEGSPYVAPAPRMSDDAYAVARAFDGIRDQEVRERVRELVRSLAHPRC